MSFSNVDDAIDCVMMQKHSPDEWRMVQKASAEYLRTASPEDIEEWLSSGAGDTLLYIMNHI